MCDSRTVALPADSSTGDQVRASIGQFPLCIQQSIVKACTAGMRVMLIAGKLDDSATLPLLAPYCDCIVNSANNNLLTPGVTGIAKAIRDLGGAAVQSECDAAKAEHGGDVPVGTAVWTTAGSLGCRKGIAHAITLRYNRGVREPTTPDLVGAAFEAALALADAHDARTLACYVMCAREGYSTVPRRRG